MGFFTNPTSYRINNPDVNYASSIVSSSNYATLVQRYNVAGNSHPNLGHLILLIFEASMEVVCVSLPGYILARQGMFSVEDQKFVANLNVALFTPCLIFTKLASQLTAEKLIDLAIIPAVFTVQTIVSYLVSVAVSKAFGFGKRPANFVTAMGVFGNSNSLPISLVISLSQTIKGLHWDKIPGDNDDEVAARGILYLLIFQQLGQLVRWSWGYHVLLAPPEKIVEDIEQGIETGRYFDDPDMISGVDSKPGFRCTHISDQPSSSASSSTTSLRSEDKTMITKRVYNGLNESEDESAKLLELTPTLEGGNDPPNSDQVRNNQTSIHRMCTPPLMDEQDIPPGFKGTKTRIRLYFYRFANEGKRSIISTSSSMFNSLPSFAQNFLLRFYAYGSRFLAGVWEFMNPPLWAMLSAVVVASVPKLQHTFFTEGTFIANSFTRAVSQSGGVAVPLILVVLGANLARNTLPQESHEDNSEENEIGKKLLIASLLSRMVFPALIMAPLLAITARYIPVSIVDDPIFVVVCFLLTGAPSALQLAQICQINGVYEKVMGNLLFHSYVIWIFPSTLALVTCALEVLVWANK